LAAIFITTMDARREEAESGSATPLPQQQVEKIERNSAIRRALDSLPEKERRLLELYYYEDRTLLEAGQALGLSKSWSSRLHARAITLLKQALEKVDVQPDQPVPPQTGKRRAKR
jgi:RNA polymerase sigma factor for flagellar operon FliA